MKLMLGKGYSDLRLLQQPVVDHVHLRLVSLSSKVDDRSCKRCRMTDRLDEVILCFMRNTTVYV